MFPFTRSMKGPEVLSASAHVGVASHGKQAHLVLYRRFRRIAVVVEREAVVAAWDHSKVGEVGAQRLRDLRGHVGPVAAYGDADRHRLERPGGDALPVRDHPVDGGDDAAILVV